MGKPQVVLLIGVAVLSVAICGLNLKLHAVNGRLKTQLNTEIAFALATKAPATGWAMPPLSGQRVDGSAIGIDLQHSYHSMVVLLFDPNNCPACEANWTYWDKLLADPDKARLLMFVTAASSVPTAYLRHYGLEREFVMTGLDPGMLKQMRMQAAPQT